MRFIIRYDGLSLLISRFKEFKMTYSIIAAFALVLVIEGVMPFIAPNFWRKMITAAAMQPDRALRIYGLICMIAGVVILVITHHYTFR